HPDACAERPLEVETQLLAELAPERRGVVLAFLGASAGCSPEAPRGNLEADEDDPLVRVDDERPDAGPEPHGASSRSARNHRSRSSQGTAAFAGDVDGGAWRAVLRGECDGRTKGSASRSRRSWSPCAGRPPNGPRYASLPTKPMARGRSSRGSRSSRPALPAKAPFPRAAER